MSQDTPSPKTTSEESDFDADDARSETSEATELPIAATGSLEEQLILAVEERRFPEVEKLLRRKAGVTATNETHETALHLAADHDNLEIVKLLCAAKAPINAKDDQGATALLIAGMKMEESNEELTLYLLDQKASFAPKEAYNLLSNSAYLGHLGVLNRILESSHAYMSNSEDWINFFGSPAILHNAVSSGSIPVVERLLKEPAVLATIGAQDIFSGETILHLAINNADVPMVARLLAVEGIDKILGVEDHKLQSPIAFARSFLESLIQENSTDLIQETHEKNTKMMANLKTIIGFLSRKERAALLAGEDPRLGAKSPLRKISDIRRSIYDRNALRFAFNLGGIGLPPKPSKIKGPCPEPEADLPLSKPEQKSKKRKQEYEPDALEPGKEARVERVASSSSSSSSSSSAQAADDTQVMSDEPSSPRL